MRALHPTVTLAEGVTLTDTHWAQHGQLLAEGMPNHRVRVRGFIPLAFGGSSISMDVSPLSEPEPLRFRES